MPTWFITGCSTGFGRELALAVLERGWNAIVTARDVSTVQDIVGAYPETATALPLDVGDRAQIDAAVAAAGEIDVLVNNAGHGYRSAVEEAPQGDLDELFGTNLFGAVHLTQAVLPGMRRRKSGAIVNISSIAGITAGPGSGYYSASKAALEMVSDALRKEVGPLGIKVLVIAPGPFRTDFAGRSLLQSSVPIGDYAPTAGQRRKEHDTMHGTQAGDPKKAATAIIKAVEAPDAPFRLYLGGSAVEHARGELRTRLEEIDAWEPTSVDTDFS